VLRGIEKVCGSAGITLADIEDSVVPWLSKELS
jgi:hypothetical protein